MKALFANQTFIYLLFFVAASIVSFLVNRWLLSRSVKLGVRDLSKTDMIRWTSVTKPSVGGISFFALFVLSFVGVAIFGGSELLFSNASYIGLFAAMSFAFLLGLADDVYNINPSLKFMGQLLCANVLYFSGIFIDISILAEINYVLTLLWVVGMMNSINMLDNMDGITGITSAAIILATLGVMLVSGAVSVPYLILMLGVLGALIGFLRLNWNPAKVYMGDAGSQFLGAFLASIAMVFLWNIYGIAETQLVRWSQFALPLIVFVLPIIDTLTVSFRRIAKGQSPFVGDRNHTTHNLAIWGLQDYQVGLTFGAVSCVSILFGTWVYLNIVAQPILCSLMAFVYFLLLFGGIQMVYQINIRKSKQMAARQAATPKVKNLKPVLQVSRSRTQTVKDKSIVG